MEEVGIPLVNAEGSRVVISTRSINVIRRMGANDYSIPIEPLSSDEAWQLFYSVAFKTGGAPRRNIEDIARQIAGKCKGFAPGLKGCRGSHDQYY